MRDPRFWIGKMCAEGKVLGPNVLEKVLTLAAATTGAVGSKELFTVTGEVLCTMVPVCETDLTGSGTICFGVDGDTDLFSGGDITATALDAGEFALHTTPPAFISISDTVPQWIYVSDDDLGYQVKTDTVTAGVVRVYCLWYPLSTDANVEVAGVNVSL